MIVGIDLETTKSVIGVRKDNKIYIIENENGDINIHSLITSNSEEKIFVWESCKKSS